MRRLHASGLLASGGAPQQLLASLLIPLLSDGILEAHIKTVREVYGKRLRTVIQALEREGLRQFLLEPERWGGFFVFLRFPAPSEALEIRKRGMEKGVACSPGEWFSPLPTWPDGPKDDELIGGEAKNRCVRLAFTFYEESVLDQGIAKLGEVVRGLLKENGL